MYQWVSSTLRALINNAGATITISFSAADSVRFYVAYLESIFINLITNALKYAAPQRLLRLHICSCDEGDNVQLMFTDNGIGMDMGIGKDKIFGMYQRFHNHPDSKGIALYFVKLQLAAIGGNIIMESCLDVGTIFTFTFKKFIV